MRRIKGKAISRLIGFSRGKAGLAKEAFQLRLPLIESIEARV
jgi:hypothetical protein